MAAAAAVVVSVATGTAIATTSYAAAAGCQVTYTVGSTWAGGFSANVGVVNLGDALSSWTLRWSFSAGQTVTQAWDATVTQSASAVTAFGTTARSGSPRRSRGGITGRRPPAPPPRRLWR